MFTNPYPSISYWDKEKKQLRSKRKLFGKRNPDTGEIIPTDGRGRKPKGNPEAAKSTKPGPAPIETANRRFYGATYLLDELGNTLGLTEDLKQCFPATYRQIRSIAYYII